LPDNRQSKEKPLTPISDCARQIRAIAYRFSIGITVNQLAQDYETTPEDIEQVLREFLNLSQNKPR